MPQPRRNQISLVDTPYYHCISRCVRRSYLCGIDKYTGHSYEHRRGWVEDRLLFLSTVFSISICAYAVMSNHTHIVLHVDKSAAHDWKIDEVLRRYHKIHKGTLLTQKYVFGDKLTPGELITFDETVELYRKRLYDISWFMRNINEHIAREANKEDNCTGRFWEGRFKSQALLDESALLACMAYVDLNPIRAKVEKSPKTSKYTTIKKRLQALNNKQQQPKNLMPFIGNPKQNSPKGITYSLENYCELVQTTSRSIIDEKTDHIEKYQSPILQQLGLDSAQWLILVTEFEKHFFCAAGAELMMNTFKRHTHHQRIRGMGKAKELLKRA